MVSISDTTLRDLASAGAERFSQRLEAYLRANVPAAASMSSGDLREFTDATCAKARSFAFESERALTLWCEIVLREGPDIWTVPPMLPIVENRLRAEDERLEHVRAVIEERQWAG